MPEIQGLQGKPETYLSNISPSDARFESHKATSQKLARLYGLDTQDGFQGFISGKRLVMFSGFSAKIEKCGSWLSFVKAHDQLKLVDARFCKASNCPMCQWRRSLKWRAKFLEMLPAIREKYESHKFVFLTLTIRNCDIEYLKGTIRHLNEAFNRLSKNVRFPMVGLVKSVEVTRAWDCYDAFSGESLGIHGSKWVFQYQQKQNTALRLEPTRQVHPHLHIVGMVKPSYFKHKTYVKHSEWVALWRKALRIDYDPIVNIKTVKCTKLPTPDSFNNTNDDGDGMISAICETLKYTVKEQDLIGSVCDDEEANSQWLKQVTEQLYKTRKVEYRGVFKELGKELEAAYEDDDLIKVKEDKETVENGELEEVTFTWYEALQRYVLRSESVEEETC